MKRTPSNSGFDHDNVDEMATNPYNGRTYSENYYKILETRQKLPVFEQKAEIIKTVMENRITIIEGSTGSGKTTQIPQFLLESSMIDPRLRIVCTQPRRVAAINVATRVSQEMDIALGREVGYCVRFEAKESDATKLVYMTDGLLMREFVMDPNVEKYGIIIIDEAHERTINSDIILGILKRLVLKRDDLRVVVMSATLEATKFTQFFTSPQIPFVPHLIVPGRLHHVKLVYTSVPVPNYIDEAVSRVLKIHTEDNPGDILLFMTGEEEIENTCTRIRNEVSGMRSSHPQMMGAYVLPLYASLPARDQAKVFIPAPVPNTRKIIVSTNIAETSVTIDGVVYVVDPGFVKQNRYIPERRMSSLLVTNISKAASIQRAGRAGRTQPGKCYRLYTKDSFEKDLPEQTLPEIQRSDLCSVLLLMLAAGIDDIVRFPFIDPPDFRLLVQSIEELYYLGAIGMDGKLTEVGRLMSMIPIEPKLSRSLIAANEYGCTYELCGLVALLSEQGNILSRPRSEQNQADLAHRQFKSSISDHLTLVKVVDFYEKNQSKQYCTENYINHRLLERAIKARSQLFSILKRNGIEIMSIPPDSPSRDQCILQSLLKGLFMQVCYLNPTTNKYLFMTCQKEAEIHPSSSVRTKPSWVVYDEYIYTNTDYIRTVSEIKTEWLFQSQSEYFNPERFPYGTVKQELKRLFDTNKKTIKN